MFCITKEETVRKLFALIANKRKEWAKAARESRTDQLLEEAEEEEGENDEVQDEGGEGEDHDDRSDSEPKPKSRRNDGEREEQPEEENEAGDGDQEGEEEAGDDDDPVTEITGDRSSSCHANLKRDRLSKMLSEIASLEKKLAESLI